MGRGDGRDEEVMGWGRGKRVGRKGVREAGGGRRNGDVEGEARGEWSMGRKEGHEEVGGGGRDCG